jgi:hypothetical protein
MHLTEEVPAEQIAAAIAVEVRQLRTETDASPRGDRAGPAAGFEPDRRTETRLARAAQVSVDREAPAAELAEQQVGKPIAVPVGEQGRRVAQGQAVDLAVNLEPEGLGQDGVLGQEQERREHRCRG